MLVLGAGRLEWRAVRAGWAAGAAWVTAAGWSAWVTGEATAGLLRDLVVLRHLDGLFDALEVDTDDATAAVRWHSVLGRWHAVRGADSTAESAAAAAAARVAAVLLLLEEDLTHLLERDVFIRAGVRCCASKRGTSSSGG